MEAATAIVYDRRTGTLPGRKMQAEEANQWNDFRFNLILHEMKRYNFPESSCSEIGEKEI